MNRGEKGGGIFGIASGNAPPAFEVKEGIFDEMTQFVEVAIILALMEAVFFGRNDSSHALFCGLQEDGIGIVAAIGQKISGAHALDKSASLRAISLGAFCNKDSDRQTMRIHGQMQLGVEPPFVRLMA